MGILDIFRKKEQTQDSDSVVQTKKENLSSRNMIDLRKETFEISLAKNDMVDTKARVALVIDDSGSMSRLYNNGTIQETIERLLPVALKLDDNAELDMWIFDDGFKRMKSITEKDFDDYVNKTILKNASWGCTDYSPVMRDVIKKYTKEEPSNIPTFVIFITDGENSDRTEAKKTIIEASNHNIFWQFVGIGREDFKFLKTLDTMEGRTVDNANFFEINDISKISDGELYDRLINEYPSWEKEAKKIGIIK